MKDCSSFTVAIDAGNNLTECVLDIRRRCYHQDESLTSNIRSIPLDVHLVKNILDCLHPEWPKKLSDLCSDDGTSSLG